MMRVLVLFSVALVSTMPGMGIAALYLRSRGIDAPEGVVRTFMKTAPIALRIVVIALNFFVFTFVYGYVRGALMQAGS